MKFDDSVILLDKPAGITSFAAVRRLRRATQVDKAGHSGSLDPLATGLLIVCTGVATRLASIFVEEPKLYLARVRFGRATDSYDADGRTTAEATVPPLEPERVRRALTAFQGEIEQRPPMVSAVKIQGKRLYELARRGETVERATRPVMVYEITLVELGAAHADLRVRCGRGCYVRSIAHELGEALGIPAHLESLRRAGVGRFSVEQAAPLAAFETVLRRQNTRENDGDATRAASRAANPAATVAADAPTTRTVVQAALGLREALADLPALRMRRSYESGTQNGIQPGPHALCALPQRSGKHVLLSEDGRRLLGLVDVASRDAPGGVGPLRLALVFPTPIGSAETGPA
jgi:tRNA pseudouridine55 synthase